MAIDHDLAAKLAEKAFTAVQAGAKATLDNPNEISQTVLGVLAVSLNAVPVVGSAIAAFAVALSLIAFPAPTKDPWDKVRERVEALVGQKLQAHQLKTLQSRIDGFRLNSDHYAKVWKGFQDAPADAREKQAELLRTHHSGFLLQLRSGIPEFQIDDYAAAALPLFAQAANVHVALLADGIRNGKDWGFPEEHYGKTLPEEFQQMTASGGGNKAARGVEARAATDSALLDMGKTAIDAAEGLGVDPALLALWKEAYASLVHQFAVRSETQKRSTTDYVAHVNRWYVEGRKQVTPRQWNRDEGKPYYDRGHREALALATYSDYDTEMVENVLSYAEFWPYLATDGAQLSAASLRNLDREVFRGPYMRYTEHARWSAAAAPPVTDRGAPITAVRMCVSENVRELQVRYGDKWGPVFGKCHNKEREERSFTLKDGEYIENVDIYTGHKLGQLQFVTNLGTVYGPYGDPTHAKLPMSVNRTGYALTSMYSTHYEHAAPEGIEGIFFGFRPLLTAKKE